MRYKRLLAWVLTFIIAVGMLPILPARVVNAGEGDGEPVNNVVRSLKGITEPAGGWGRILPLLPLSLLRMRVFRAPFQYRRRRQVLIRSSLISGNR